jgi:hypothetical protein
VKRRTFLTLFASAPAVLMAQRAIPAALGEPQLIRANEAGWWTVAVGHDGRELHREPATVGDCVDYLYDGEDRPMLERRWRGLQSTFPTYKCRGQMHFAEMQLCHDGRLIVAESYNFVWTTAQTLHVKWEVLP